MEMLLSKLNLWIFLGLQDKVNDFLGRENSLVVEKLVD